METAPARQPGTGLPLHEAAAALGLSFDALLRQLRAGRARAERIERPQGYVWRVYVEVNECACRDAAREAPGPVRRRHDAPADAAWNKAMGAHARSLFEPLVRRAEEHAGIGD